MGAATHRLGRERRKPAPVSRYRAVRTEAALASALSGWSLLPREGVMKQNEPRSKARASDQAPANSKFVAWCDRAGQYLDAVSALLGKATRTVRRLCALVLAIAALACVSIGLAGGVQVVTSGNAHAAVDVAGDELPDGGAVRGWVIVLGHRIPLPSGWLETGPGD